MPAWIRHLLPALLLATACASSPPSQAGDPGAAGTADAPPLTAGQAEAVFAGGCFWCMEKPFDHVDGVLSTTSGYTGGSEEHPTYSAVSNKLTHHYESLRVVYDPSRTSYEALLQVYWHNVDPTDARGQFCDKGPQYRTAIFTNDPDERALAEQTRSSVAARLHAEIATEILPRGPFWEAEDYHQDFYQKSPAHYTSYRAGCGRDARLKELWGEDAGH